MEAVWWNVISRQKKKTVVYNDALDFVAISPYGILAVAIEGRDRNAPGTTFKIL